MFCPKCGIEATADGRFCMACGAPLPEAGTVVGSTSLPRPQYVAVKRPRWVWVIFCFYLFSAAWVLLSFFLVYWGVVPLNPAQQAYLANLGILDFVATVGLTLLSFTAAVFLFCLQRTAVDLFAIALAYNLAFSLIHLLTTHWAQAFGGSGIVGASFGWCIPVAVLLYARRLAREGVLT